MSPNVGFLLSGILCLVTVVMLTAVLADGRSMFEMSSGNYAVGASYDTFGYGWDDSKNNFNSCDDYTHRFKLLQGATYISLLAAGLAVIVSMLGTGSLSRIWGLIAFVLNIGLFVFVLIAMAVGWALWSEEYECGLVSVKIKDFYDVSYGPIFLVFCFIFGLVNVIVLAVTGTLSSRNVNAEAVMVHEPVVGHGV
ncbi:hypothetical protein DIPPA_01461 [Diplonema papillatum]|nr:hypothetical protein DIPPA_01461 [Diplonema papillatum]